MRCLFVLVAFFLLKVLAPSTALANCENPALPPIDNKSYWYCDTGSETVIVFVHGFNSNNRTAWLRRESGDTSPSVYWPNLVLRDDRLAGGSTWRKRPSIFLASYFTGFDSTSFGLQDAANQLFTALSESWGGKPPAIDRKNILFVGHSAGGVVTRDMLVRRAEDFAGKRLAILLVASPSNGSRYARDLAPPQALAENLFVKQLAVKSEYLTTLDRKFREAVAPGGSLQNLRGKEIYEHRILSGEIPPDATWLHEIRTTVLETAAKAVWERVVEPSSAAVYFPDPMLIPNSNHSSIAHPTDVNRPQHHALRHVYRQLLATRAQPCDPPPHLKVVFKMSRRGAEGPSSYQLVQLDQAGDPLRTGLVERNRLSGYYTYPVTEAPFACPGEAFWAKLARVSATSQLEEASSKYTDACFRRSRINHQAKRAVLTCEEGHRCDVDTQTPGIAERCEGPIKVHMPALQETQHWVVPSLSTLERQSDQVRSGYAEFTVDSKHVSEIESATEISFAVSSNGVPIYMDGLEHHLERLPFDGRSPVHLTFALENLGFTGGIDGYEQIEVDIRFYSGKSVLKSARLKLEYVSYRHSPARTAQDAESSDKYVWSARYWPAKIRASNEVVIEYGPLDWVKKRRTLFDASGRLYKGQPVVGVIRPARKDNPVSGYIVGLKLATGQIKSLFTKKEADAICRWVTAGANFDEMQRDGAYIFQFPPEAFTARLDKGKRVAYCQDI
ncbi:MAG: hypothetical protein RIC14_04615 [Filomicrobium sp.]